MDVYGSKTLLCSELCHKIVNMETVFEFMERMHREFGPEGYKEKVANYLIGLTVMTSYNNKTYRIDDINWDVNPMSTFEKRSGVKVSFIDYYYEHYKIKIKDPKQPLLVSQIKMKKRPVPGASAETTNMSVLLIPEQCVLTGLFAITCVFLI